MNLSKIKDGRKKVMQPSDLCEWIESQGFECELYGGQGDYDIVTTKSALQIVGEIWEQAKQVRDRKKEWDLCVWFGNQGSKTIRIVRSVDKDPAFPYDNQSIETNHGELDIDEVINKYQNAEISEFEELFGVDVSLSKETEDWLEKTYNFLQYSGINLEDAKLDGDKFKIFFSSRKVRGINDPLSKLWYLTEDKYNEATSLPEFIDGDYNPGDSVSLYLEFKV